MDGRFLNCRSCGKFVAAREAIFCFNCGNTIHTSCLPVPITREEFQDLIWQNYLHFCDRCSSDIQEKLSKKFSHQKARIISTYSLPTTVSCFTVTNNPTFSSTLSSINAPVPVININNSTQMDIVGDSLSITDLNVIQPQEHVAVNAFNDLNWDQINELIEEEVSDSSTEFYPDRSSSSEM